jgi:hypothetical protein
MQSAIHCSVEYSYDEVCILVEPNLMKAVVCYEVYK